jgi:hypothetical protein
MDHPKAEYLLSVAALLPSLLWSSSRSFVVWAHATLVGRAILVLVGVVVNLIQSISAHQRM